MQGEQSPLHLACEVEAADCVRELIRGGANLAAEDAQLRTPLLIACEAAAFGAAKALLEGGASAGTADESGMTPLHWLSLHGCSELLPMVLRAGGEVDAVDSRSRTPLWYAVTKGRMACAMLLLDAGADCTLGDERKRTALHLTMEHLDSCASSEATLLLLRLLQERATDVKRADRDKRTALHWACGKNATPCVRALLGAGAAADATDSDGRTPVHWACAADALEALVALHEHGGGIDALDRDLRTPLHWTADKAAERCMAWLLSADAQSRQPLDVNVADWGGFTALHYAARRGGAAARGCIKRLLAAGADRQIVALGGVRPLDMAADPETAKLLSLDTAAAGGPGGGLKRRRSLSSGNALVLLEELPTLARKFYAACAQGDFEALRDLCSDDALAATRAHLLSTPGAVASAKVGEMHVVPRSRKVFVEVSMGGGAAGGAAGDAAGDAAGGAGGSGAGGGCSGEGRRAPHMHTLTFDEDGALVSFAVFGAVEPPTPAAGDGNLGLPAPLPHQPLSSDIP